MLTSSSKRRRIFAYGLPGSSSLRSTVALRMPLLVALAVGCCGLITNPVHAADVTSTWVGGDGWWGEIPKWSNEPPVDQYPNNGNGGFTYDAIIDAAGPSYTVNLDADVAVNNFLLNSSDATLNHTAGTFSANTTIADGIYRLDRGTIANSTISVVSSGKLRFWGGPGGSGTIANSKISVTGGQFFVRPEYPSQFHLGTLKAVTLQGNLDVFDYSVVTVTDGLTLSEGSITFSSAGAIFDNRLDFVGDQTLAGTGKVVFDGTFANGWFRPLNGALTIAPGITVQTGTQTGGVGDPNYGLVNQGTLSAQTAGTTLYVSGKNWVNQGILQAKNGATLSLAGTIVPGGLGQFDSTDGKVVLTGTLNNDGHNLVLNGPANNLILQGGTIAGGTVSTTGGAELRVAPDPWGGPGVRGTLQGVTLDGTLVVPWATGVAVRDGLTLANGTILLESAAGSPFSAWLQFADSQAQTLGGTGEVVFAGNAWSGGCQVTSTTGTLTIGPGITIRTATQGGIVGNADSGLINQGRILAQGGPITVMGKDFVNEGKLEAKDGGALTIDGTWSNKGTIAVSNGTINLGGSFNTASCTITGSDGTINIKGTLNNTGSTFILDGSVGKWNLLGGTIVGGTVSSTGGAQLFATQDGGVLKGVTLDAGLVIPVPYYNGWVQVQDGLTLSQNGKIHLEGSDWSPYEALLYFPGSQTLTGTGEVIFDAGGYKRICASDGTLTIGSGVTVRTGGSSRGGTVGHPDSGLVNQGTISAQTPDATISIVAQNWTNRGAIEAKNKAYLAADGNWTNHSAGVMRSADGGNLNLKGNWTNRGAMEAKGNAYLTADGNWTNESGGVMRSADGGFLILKGNWTNKGLIDVQSRLIVTNADDALYNYVLQQLLVGRMPDPDPIRPMIVMPDDGDMTPYISLGMVWNGRLGAPPTLQYFDGYPVNIGDILVKPTWNGDANLDGVVNADDYFLIDNGFITQAPGCQNGDFNYDGVINADDYFLIDSAFLCQTGPLSAAVRAPAVPEPATLFFLAFASLTLISRRRRA